MKSESQILQEAYKKLPEIGVDNAPYSIFVKISEVGSEDEACATFTYTDKKWKFFSIDYGNGLNRLEYFDSIPKMRLTYWMQSADESGVNLHPQLDMKGLGIDVLSSECISVSDCWIFDVRAFDFELPNYIKVSKAYEI